VCILNRAPAIGTVAFYPSLTVRLLRTSSRLGHCRSVPQTGANAQDQTLLCPPGHFCLDLDIIPSRRSNRYDIANPRPNRTIIDHVQLGAQVHILDKYHRQLLHLPHVDLHGRAMEDLRLQEEVHRQGLQCLRL
jgi:hypothetical protein